MQSGLREFAPARWRLLGGGPTAPVQIYRPAHGLAFLRPTHVYIRSAQLVND